MPNALWLLCVWCLSWVVDTQFTCTVGVDCKLPLYDYDMPSTPSVRVGEAPCGSVSTSSMLEMMGTPVADFPLGVMPSIVGHGSLLNVCLAASGGADPSHSISFGTLDVIGPTVSAVYPCYFGSTCDITVTGNKLTEVTSLLFVTDTGNCSIVPPPTTLYGLLSPRSVLASSTTSFPYISFGRVTPELAVQQSLALCWSAIDVRGRSLPVSIGAVSLEGPTDRSRKIVCHMGSDCVFSYQNLTAGHSYFRTSDSDTKACDFTNNAVTAWSGTSSVSVAVSASDYSFGAPLAANNLEVNETALCWSSSPSGPFLAKVGTLTMVGPTRSDTAFTCTRGMSCDIAIPGVFPLAATGSKISLRSHSCAGNLVNLDLDLSQPASVNAVYTGTRAVGTFVAIGLAVPNVVVCWEVDGGSFSVQAGLLAILGPSDIATLLSCELSQACELQLSVTGFEAGKFNQSALLVASPVGAHADPCHTFTPEELYFESTAEFVFPSINRVVDTALVRSLCWRVQGGSRAVPIGEWFVSGPLANAPGYTCKLGDANPCEVTLSFSNTPNEDSVLFLTNVSSCESSNIRSRLPSIRGGSVVGSVASVSSFTKTWSFGSVLGWTDVGDNGERIFELCYATSKFRRRPAVAGTLTIDRAVGVVPGTACVIGEVCEIEISNPQSLILGYRIYLSVDVGCASNVTAAISESSSGTFVFDQLAGGFEGTSIFVCGSDGLNLGTIAVEGMALSTAGCIMGSPADCIIQVVSRGAWVDSDIAVSWNCSENQPMIGFNNSGSVSWAIADTAHIVSSDGIARIPHSTRRDLSLCLNGMAVGGVAMTGPLETNTLACVNGGSCTVELEGLFPSNCSSCSVSLVTHFDLNSYPTSNPCNSASVLTSTASISRSNASFLAVTFEDVQLESGLYSVCWRHAANYESVPAGSLQLSGAKFNRSISCVVSSTQKCAISVAVVGVSLPDTKVGVAPTSDCRGALTNIPLDVSAVFLVGPLPVVLNGATLCWSSGLGGPAFAVGSIAQSRVPCNEKLFYPRLLEEDELRTLVTATDLACEVSVSVGGLSERFSLVRFAFAHMADAIDSGGLAAAIVNLRAPEEMEPVLNEVQDGETVLMTAIRTEALTDLIAALIARNELDVDLETAQMAVTYERDDVCALLVERLDITQVEPLLPLAVTANMPECISAISSRRLSATSAALGLAAAVNTTNVAAFHAIVPLCEPMESCLEVQVAGLTSLGDILRARKIGDTIDPFWMMARDHLT